MQPYRVVLYSAEHQRPVAKLMRHLWSADSELNFAYLDWKYRRNPYITGPLIYLAFQDDSLAGMRGCLGTKWEAGDAGETFVMPYPDDLIVDPAHRAQGLHRIIMEFALADLRERGYRHAVNLSATRYTMLASTRMKWRDAGKVSPLLRRTVRATAADTAADTLRSLPALWRWSDRVAGWGGAGGERVFDRLDARLRPRTGKSSQAIFVEDVAPAAEMAGLVRRLPNAGRIRHVRDETYFGWRFGNPFRRYRVLCAGGDRLEGYLVLQRCVDVIGTRVAIVDWEAEDEHVRAALLAAAIAEGGFAAISAWAQGLSSAAAETLAREGFAPAQPKHEHVILVRSLQDAELKGPWTLAGRRLDDAADWELRMIYSMAG